jgi:hypothetical protein
MEQAREDGTTFDFCMNGCDDKKKKIIYELKEPGGSDIWWYCEDCASAEEIESGYLKLGADTPAARPRAMDPPAALDRGEEVGALLCRHSSYASTECQHRTVLECQS